MPLYRRRIYQRLKIRQLLFTIVDWFDPFFKKQSNKVLFVVKKNTVFSANHRVMCEYFISNNLPQQLAVLSIGGIPQKIKQELLENGVKIFSSFSISYLFYLWRCGIVFISHSVRDSFLSSPSSTRLIINYWHGATFKKIENLMHNLDDSKKRLIKKNAKIYDYIIASSQGDRELMSASFGVPLTSVHALGLPRYDLLTSPNIYFKYSKPVHDYFNKLHNSYNQVILYAPTFRESAKSPLESISKTELQQINSFLKKHNHILLIRPHYYDKSTLKESFSNIKMLEHENYHETNIILTRVSMLIVDYSSIWVDFLLINKPIIFFCKDLEHYHNKERGLNYDIDFLPGCISQDVDTLITSIKKNISEDLHIKRRNIVKKYFHDYDNSTSCTEALIKAVPEILTGKSDSIIDRRHQSS